MRFRKNKRSVPELNTTSTADISFMLLIFFLVTTSMEVDKGMPRQLPPNDPDKQEQTDVDRTKVVTLSIKEDGSLIVENGIDLAAGESQQYSLPFKDKDAVTFRRNLKNFIITTGPEHIVEIHTARDAQYEYYFSLQNEIVRCYRELRKSTKQDIPQRIQEVAE